MDEEAERASRCRGNSRLGLGWVCLLFVVFSVFSVSCSYSIAVFHGHIYPFLPSISETGVKSPEKYVFRELFNLSTFLFITNAYVRFMQYQLVAEQCRDDHHWLTQLNEFTFTVGICSGIAMTFVANFEVQKTMSLHDIAAVVSFSACLAYCWLQCLMSYKLMDHGVINSSAICHTRTVLATIITMCFVVFLSCQLVSTHVWDSVRPEYHHLAKLHWGPTDPAYGIHLVGSIAEWTMCASFLMFMSTFLKEFQQIKITSDISSTEYW